MYRQKTLKASMICLPHNHLQFRNRGMGPHSKRLHCSLERFPSENLRSRSQVIDLWKKKQEADCLTDEEVLFLVDACLIAAHQLEKVLGNPERGVRIRRMLLSHTKHQYLSNALQQVPFQSFDYTKVCVTSISCSRSMINEMETLSGLWSLL